MSYRPARLHRLADRYDNSVPTRFLNPIDCRKLQYWTGHNVRDGRVKTNMLFSIFVNIRSFGFDKISHNLTKFHKVSFQFHLRENHLPLSVFAQTFAKKNIFEKQPIFSTCRAFCSCLAHISQKRL
jgi:hypothetical protein